jgi:hypothetical protein
MKWFHLFILIGFLALIASAADKQKSDAVQVASTEAAKVSWLILNVFKAVNFRLLVQTRSVKIAPHADDARYYKCSFVCNIMIFSTKSADARTRSITANTTVNLNN